jgi:hypothetical protein
MFVRGWDGGNGPGTVRLDYETLGLEIIAGLVGGVLGVILFLGQFYCFF